MRLDEIRARSFGWRWYAAAILFSLGFLGLFSGVTVSERPDVVTAGALTQAYYALGLFVVGGLDIGTPVGGPVLGQIALWIAYFGAPLLTASAVIEAVIKVLAPDRWRLRRMRDHIVVFGSGRLTVSYLRMLRELNNTPRVVVVDDTFDSARMTEFEHRFAVTPVLGRLTHNYLLRHLRLRRARRVFLFDDNDFESFEAATRILELAPGLENKLVLHCHNLRFLRSVQDTELSTKAETFNIYHFAATGFVRDKLIDHFHRTQARDTVVMAGFGRFGQSVLEQLELIAPDEIEQVVVIDRDADRRMLVAEEQERLGLSSQRSVFQGDVANPDVWSRVFSQFDLSKNEPTIIMGTGQEQDNIRTALWLKRRYPNALVFARTNDVSRFALQLGVEHDIQAISITQLVENNIPADWIS